MNKKDTLFLQTKQQALALLRARNFAGAVPLLEDVVRKDPFDADSWTYLSVIYSQAGQAGDFERCCRGAITANPELPNAHFNLGVALGSQGRTQEAIQCFRRTIQLKPDHVLALYNLGHWLQQGFVLDEARSCYERVLASKPTATDQVPANFDATVSHSLANVLKAQGRMADANGYYRQALSLDPDMVGGHSDMLLALNYDPPEPGHVFEEHLRWDLRHGYKGPIAYSYRQSRDPKRPLRIGYLSPDLYHHAVTFFFEPLLAEYDRSQFVTVCYAARQKSDFVTAHLKALSAHWRDVSSMNDEQVAYQIHDDQIDILVDLTGHMGENRLPVFSRKPAPIQVSWLGYPNTTGLRTMDYRLTDEVADPPGLTDRFYTERLVRLPRGFLCYRPSPTAPAVGPLPLLANGFVTFGSFNNLSKITPSTIDVWCSILHAVPHSRLILKNASFTDIPTRQPYYQEFEKHGIEPDRLDFRGMHRDLADHQATYCEIDIALDPFPYNGATTTCESLWMGVPVVTLAGDRHASRVGASLLTQVSLPEFIADTPDEYIRIALDNTHEWARLAELRRSLREKMAASPLCDAKAFARAVEDAYRHMWAKWCT